MILYYGCGCPGISDYPMSYMKTIEKQKSKDDSFSRKRYIIEETIYFAHIKGIYDYGPVQLSEREIEHINKNLLERYNESLTEEEKEWIDAISYRYGLPWG